jgi:glycerol kinase
VPALAGLACPHWDRSARGAWLGLSLDSSPADMMQALLEGVALRMGEVAAALQETAPLSAPVSIDGGMAANHYFCQFLADTLQREIIVSDQPELTAIGAAALAAEAVGKPFDFRRSGRRVLPGDVPSGRAERFAAARQAIQAYGNFR